MISIQIQADLVVVVVAVVVVAIFFSFVVSFSSVKFIHLHLLASHFLPSLQGFVETMPSSIAILPSEHAPRIYYTFTCIIYSWNHKKVKP